MIRKNVPVGVRVGYLSTDRHSLLLCTLAAAIAVCFPLVPTLRAEVSVNGNGLGVDNVQFLIVEVPSDPADPTSDLEPHLHWQEISDCTTRAPVGNPTDLEATDAVDALVVTGGDEPNCIDASPVEADYEFTIRGGGGDDIIFGSGGDDEIQGQGGNDLIRGNGGSDTLSGGPGWDVLDYSGDPGGVTVDFTDGRPASAADGWGEAGGDDEIGNESDVDFEAIRGSGSADTLIGHADRTTTILGGGGNDVIMGGREGGGDVLFGEDGNDAIAGYHVNIDDLNSPNHRLRGVPDAGDDDGDSDLILGGTGNDRIWGGRGSDTLLGDGDPAPLWPPLGTAAVAPISFGNYVPPVTIPDGGGSDQIWGGNGSDLIHGGGGGDIIHGDDGPIKDTPDDFADIIYGDYGGTNFNDFAPQNDLDGGNDSIRGGFGPDMIAGGAGDDLIVGGNGGEITSGDRMRGNADSGIVGDLIIGGEVLFNQDTGALSDIPTTEVGGPYDIVDYASVPTPGTGVIVQLPDEGSVPGFAISDGQLGFDIIYGCEDLVGSPNDDTLIGSNVLPLVIAFRSDVSSLLPTTYRAQFLLPFKKSNIIQGGAGNDTIFGGNDVSSGGVDLLFGQDGDDVIYGDETDGSGGPDFISGGAGNDTLSGQGGDDMVLGDAGNNLLSGGSGADTLDYSASLAPIVANLSNAQQGTQPPHTITAGTDTDTIVDCGDADSACTVSSANVNSFTARFEAINGSSFGDLIFGYESDSSKGNAPLATRILGLGGDDTLTGGPGNDTIDGGSGSDTVEGGLGDDALTGGPVPVGGQLLLSTESDTVSYANAPAGELQDPNNASKGNKGVVVTLMSTEPQNTRTAGIDTIIEFENIIGSAWNDILTGNIRANTLQGGVGADVLAGRGDTDLNINNQIIKQEDQLYGWDAAHTSAADNLLDPNDTADYRTADPTQLSVSLAAQEATNDGEGGSDKLFNIDSIISPTNPLFASAGPNRTISPGGSVVLTGSASGGLGISSDVCPMCYSFIWNTEPPTTQTPGVPECQQVIPGLNNRCAQSPTASPSKTTKYRLTVRELDESRLDSQGNPTPTGRQASAFVTVTVAPELVVNAGSDQTITLGSSTSLQGSVTGGITPYSIVWSPSEGLSATNILLPVANPSVTTTYTLTVTDNLGKVASDTVVITVTNPFFVNAGSDVVIAPGESVTLTANVTGGTAPLAYLWTPGTGLSSANVANPVATPSVTTDYTVTVTDSASRTASDTVRITVVTPSTPVDGGGNGGNGGTDGGGDGGNGGNGGNGGGDNGGDGGDGGDSGNGLFPLCGAGTGSAFMITNMLALLILKRRRMSSVL